MPASALKKLKASLQERRSSGKAGKVTKPVQSQKNKVPSKGKETPAQRANRLRQETLLPELQRRSKVGGITDRRIGENDPTLAPEDRMLKRYMAENQRSKKAKAFNLEDDSEDDDEAQLTHGGRPLSDLPRDRMPVDDYEGSEDGGDELLSRTKRPLEEAIEEITRRQEEADGEPARKKSKKEVMEEVIAKSKLHKHERQRAQEEDEDIREELDKGLPDLLALLRGGKAKPQENVTTANGERPGRDVASLEYDHRMRQMALDRRAQPSDRTKTAEEKAEEDASRLKKLEDDRQRRMEGQASEDEQSDADDQPEGDEDGDEDELEPDDAATFGFTSSKTADRGREHFSPQPELDDEDDFLIEKDLVADASDVESNSDLDDDDGAGLEDGVAGTVHAPDEDDDDDADFLRDVLPEGESGKQPKPASTSKDSSLAYTYPCPQSHSELLQVFKPIPTQDTPTVIQRIRALYHTSLAATNKAKLSAFAAALVDHIAYLPDQKPAPPLPTIEATIRHVHSMSRAFPIDIARVFRTHIARIDALPASDPHTAPTAGDLALLAAIAAIYPTSDHFHQVVTPAMTTIAHWLETLALRAQSATLTAAHALRGAALAALSMKYQARAARLVPEAVRFTTRALQQPGAPAVHIANAARMAELWSSSAAVPELLAPLAQALKQCGNANAAATSTYRTLKAQIAQARRARRALELHHHRPLSIKTALPAFEDAFNPAKHYDPDGERAAAARLRKEHRRETKAAARELRRDAEFVGREKARARREADAAYADKFRRIVGGIEREEGAQKRAYEREKEKRKRKQARF